jgi:4-aminobutyrate aminotransferase
MIAPADIMNWEAGSHASTFGGNPLSCQAAMATIDLLEKTLMKNATLQGERLMTGLRHLQKVYVCMGDVRGKGLMVGVELVKDRETKEPAADWRAQIIRKTFEKGLLLLGCGENSIRFCPALTVTAAEIDECLTIFEEAVKEVVG